MPINKPIKAVLFDLDGTLLDTAPDFAVVVNQMCAHHDRPEIEYERIRATVSHGARALVTLAFQLQEGDKGFEDKRQELLSRYSDHLAVFTKPFDGIEGLLNWLDNRALPWGVVTNKPRGFASPLMEALALHERCATLVCPDDVTHTKPHPEPLLLACKHIDCRAEETIYLGDHRRDIEAGANAGMATLAVNYGYIDSNDPIQSWQADFIVEQADEIQPLLEGLTPR